jgi:hypothetical protein
LAAWYGRYREDARPAGQAPHRGDIDDLPAALPDHHAQCLAGAVEHAVQVHGDHPVPAFQVELVHRRGRRVGDPRVVEQHVQPPEPRRRGADHGRHLVVARHVTTNGQAGPARPLDVPGRGLRAGQVDVGAHHVGAGLGHHRGELRAQPAARPGDERDLAGEVEQVVVGHGGLLGDVAYRAQAGGSTE